MTLPTFIIAGAPRSGTTYLYDLCASHPAIYMARARSPEPKFFLVDGEYAKGLDYYATTYFAQGSDFVAIGEKTTNYLEDPRVAARIAAALPEVKLVFVLRNPRERAFSNFLWSRKNGLETLDFDTALRREGEREASYPPAQRYSRPFSYISRGMYARLLQPYLQHFDRSRLQFLLADDLAKTPAAAARQLFDFLDVSSTALNFDFAARVNSARRDDDEIPPLADEFLRGVYYYPNLELGALLGRDLSPWNQARRN